LVELLFFILLITTLFEFIVLLNQAALYVYIDQVI